MVGLVTAVLAGSAVGQPAAVVSDHVLLVATIAGVLVAIAVFAALIGFQVSTWRRPAARLLDEESAHTTRPEAGDCADPTSSLESSAERARRSARSAQFGRPPARLRGFDTKWTAALRVQLRSDT
jgi:hypothetical protein